LKYFEEFVLSEQFELFDEFEQFDEFVLLEAFVFFEEFFVELTVVFDSFTESAAYESDEPKQFDEFLEQFLDITMSSF
jgi:hypothetical protein